MESTLQQQTLEQTVGVVGGGGGGGDQPAVTTFDQQDDTLLDDGGQHLGSQTHQDLKELDQIDKQAKILEWICKLQTSLTEKTSECELYRAKFDESQRQIELLSRDLNGCKLTMFQNNEDSKKIHEEVMKSKKLEEDYVRLMGNYLNLSETYDQHRAQLYDTYLAKTNAINNYEAVMSREALQHELDVCKSELDNRIAESCLLAAKLRNAEETSVVKEKCISELKKSLEDAKVSHKHEITVLEEYSQCLKNTITSYEKTLASYVGRDDDDDDVAAKQVQNQNPVDVKANRSTDNVDDGDADCSGPNDDDDDDDVAK